MTNLIRFGMDEMFYCCLAIFTFTAVLKCAKKTAYARFMNKETMSDCAEMNPLLIKPNDIHHLISNRMK